MKMNRGTFRIAGRQLSFQPMKEHTNNVGNGLQLLDFESTPPWQLNSVTLFQQDGDPIHHDSPHLHCQLELLSKELQHRSTSTGPTAPETFRERIR